ncbi:sigma-70 family RNA polymerase sigma factor [Thermaerobacillus caldiproteolyticus]|uniref:sigma-70 family RNA polymerase sigma factor n=1 Tax=Thermaerobacillus caldiproteolyticus TaxID=247480 RepID=UPI00188A4278|nr:sigma-70 family RNA polymerase sigma factor [Anoxybacillus caldiproteolyticus]QPA30058.1 sigma-70 family RNA polymerase sigma factor [Anoxybacillus caldiproteolyticus]
MAININSSQTSDNINQYVILCKIGYWEYFENVCEIYKPYINYLANKYFYKDGDKEDLIQQGLIGLYYAIQRFDPHKNKQFDSFAKLCIRKSILQIIRGSNAKKTNYSYK